MPVYAPTHLPAHMAQSPATESLRRHNLTVQHLANLNTATKVHASSAMTTNPNSASTMGTEVITKARAVSFEKSNPLVIPAQPTGTTDSSNPVIDVIMEKYECDAAVVSADGMSKGCRISNFIFLDQSSAARRLYHDCSYSHSFKVRGLTYLTDKKKVLCFLISNFSTSCLIGGAGCALINLFRLMPVLL